MPALCARTLRAQCWQANSTVLSAVAHVLSRKPAANITLSAAVEVECECINIHKALYVCDYSMVPCYETDDSRDCNGNNQEILIVRA